MALQLPDLAEKKFQDFLNDLVTSAPKYAENWDNFNPSDPGMTLVELMSFVGESTLYRLNKISNESYLQFLRLVTGAAGKKEVEDKLAAAALPGAEKLADGAHVKILNFQLEVEQKSLDKTLCAEDIPAIQKEILEFVSSRFRAVTRADFEELALEATANAAPGTLDKVARAIVVEAPEQKGKVLIYVVADFRFSYKTQGELTVTSVTGTVILNSVPGEFLIDSATGALMIDPAASGAFVDPVTNQPFFNPVTGEPVQDPLTGGPLILFEMKPPPFAWNQPQTFTRVAAASDLPPYNILTPLEETPPIIRSVTYYIRSRKLMGTPFEVRVPLYTSFSIDVKVRFASTPKAKGGVNRIAVELQRFFDPIAGGENKRGWSWGRPVSIYEISQIIENIAGVHHVDWISLKDKQGQEYNQLPIKGLARMEKLSIEPVRMEGGQL